MSEELQELSRQAAGCLGPFKWEEGYTLQDHLMLGKIDEYHRGFCWLHESTEACTEIMVRVLFDMERDVGVMDGGIRYRDSNEEFAYEYFDDTLDPLLAFRVAVLRALVALKGAK